METDFQVMPAVIPAVMITGSIFGVDLTCTRSTLRSHDTASMLLQVAVLYNKITVSAHTNCCTATKLFTFIFYVRFMQCCTMRWVENNRMYHVDAL